MHTPKSLQTGSTQTQAWNEARGVLLQSSLYSEKAATLFSTALGCDTRIFSNDKELVSGYFFQPWETVQVLLMIFQGHKQGQVNLTK